MYWFNDNTAIKNIHFLHFNHVVSILSFVWDFFRPRTGG